MCLPKLQLLSPEAETVRKIRINFYEAGTEWQARVRLQGDRVKAVIFKRGNERPFVSGFVDKDGKGSGYDFRGKLWFFRGFIKD